MSEVTITLNVIEIGYMGHAWYFDALVVCSYEPAESGTPSDSRPLDDEVCEIESWVADCVDEGCEIVVKSDDDSRESKDLWAAIERRSEEVADLARAEYAGE